MSLNRSIPVVSKSSPSNSPVGHAPTGPSIAAGCDTAADALHTVSALLSPVDPPLGSLRCYGHPDDPRGPSPETMSTRGHGGGAPHAGRTDHGNRYRSSAPRVGSPTA